MTSDAKPRTQCEEIIEALTRYVILREEVEFFGDLQISLMTEGSVDEANSARACYLKAVKAMNKARDEAIEHGYLWPNEEIWAIGMSQHRGLAH